MKEGPKKNFYCGDEVDYDDKCLEQCDRCVDATGVDYGYLPEDSKQNIIDMMKGDEELGLYDEIQPEQIWNEEKKKGVKEFIDKHKQEYMITKIMQMDAEMAYDSLPKQTLHNTDHNKFKDFSIAKKETLEEVAKNILIKKGLSDGDVILSDTFVKVIESMIEIAKETENRKQGYSEDDLKEAFKQSRESLIFEKGMPPVYESFEDWFEEFKKKSL